MEQKDSNTVSTESSRQKHYRQQDTHKNTAIHSTVKIVKSSSSGFQPSSVRVWPPSSLPAHTLGPPLSASVHEDIQASLGDKGGVAARADRARHRRRRPKRAGAGTGPLPPGGVHRGRLPLGVLAGLQPSTTSGKGENGVLSCVDGGGIRSGCAFSCGFREKTGVVWGVPEKCVGGGRGGFECHVP